MKGGDAPLNAKARLRTYHIEILDGTPPELRQVHEVLDILSSRENQPSYIHCEAGIGRTGVMVACYRMAITGWPLSDAYEEAINFGCAMPDQRRFIEDFKRSLDLGELPGYPRATGVRASSEQLRQTVALHQDPAGLAAALAAV
jgi:protein tyrosine/serine phosphatase